MSYTAPKSWELPLASKYLQLDADERAFFKAATKIEDDAELERHILDVQAQAFKVRFAQPRPPSSLSPPLSLYIPHPPPSPQFILVCAPLTTAPDDADIPVSVHSHLWLHQVRAAHLCHLA